METPQQSSNARLLAIIALVAVFVVLMVVIVTSLGGDSGSSRKGARTQSTAKAQKQSSRKTYVVKPGDTFSAIAHKVGISVERLQKLNPRIDQFTLQSGDRVKLR